MTHSSNKQGLLRVVGELDAFFETGTEGVVWSMHWAGIPGYTGLIPFRDGDRIVAYATPTQAAWDIRLQLEYQRRFRPYPLNPKYGQQEINGLWVHGFEKTMDPEKWSEPFFQQAPVVAWVECDSTDERLALARAVRRLGTQPEKAWLTFVREAPVLAKRMGSDLSYALTFVGQHTMQWSFAPPLSTDAEHARAWQILMGLDMAKRALWTPGSFGTGGVEAQLRARWPHPTPEALADIITWCSHRLPLDSEAA